MFSCAHDRKCDKVFEFFLKNSEGIINKCWLDNFGNNVHILSQAMAGTKSQMFKKTHSFEQFI